MRQLSGHNAGLLYADTRLANANVSLLHIFDQATAAGGVVRFKSILAHIDQRLSGSSLFRQRLLRVPLALDHPYWVDDDQFDLEYHVRHIALPRPGDWRQFCIQASRVHARPLDLDRPLWEAYVIEGLDSFIDLPAGSFALLLKTHLAAVGLQQLAQISTLLLDDSASPPPPGPPAPWFADSAPGTLALVRRGLVQSGTAPLRLVRPLARMATRIVPAAAALASEMLLRPHPLPPTRFNSAVSPHRVFETRRFAEAEMARVCRLVPGATVDDAVLAICGGALRAYLLAEGELPEGASLTALQPAVQQRAGPPGDAGADPAPLWRTVRLGTDIADPLRRLAFVREQADASPDALARRLRSTALAEAGAQASAALLSMTRRLRGCVNARLGPRTPPAHCTVTPVPAPAQAQFLCGARMSYYSAILPISDGLGLAFAITRHDGRVVISPTACRELVPDPEALALCLRDSFQQYLALADAGEKRARRRAGDSKSRPQKQAAKTGSKNMPRE